ncbi:MAG: DNA polymerase III subunit beta [Maioricimonas sp. JB049]
MKLECSRSLLANAFQTVSGVVPSRTPNEILKNVKLTVADGSATLVGTDQEVGVRYEIPEVVTSSMGEVLLPTQRVSAILREVQDEMLTFEVTEDALWIRGGQSEFRLSIEDPGEFPDVPTFNDEDYFIVTGGNFKKGIQRTLFATDVESTRYALGGVLLELAGETMTMAATDSRRLAVCSSSCSTQGNIEQEETRQVIPSKAMSLIERSIHDPEAEIRVAVHANDVLVASGHTTIYARLVEGRFPRYQDVVPTEFEIEIDLVVAPFLAAVRQAMIVTSEESRGVDFAFGNGALTLNSSANDVGTSKIELPISYEGDDLVITFDPRFVAEFLRVLDAADSVSLNLIDANSAAVFKADESYTYVVMPLSREDR